MKVNKGDNFMKKIIITALCAVIMLCMSACNKYGEYSEYTGTVYQTQAQTQKPSYSNVDVSFVGSKTYKAPWDDEYILVTINVTNNSNERGNYFVYLEALQDDIPLTEQDYGTLDDGNIFDSDNQKRYLDPGSSADFTYAFILKNKSDTVSVNVYSMETSKKIATHNYTFN